MFWWYFVMKRLYFVMFYEYTSWCINILLLSCSFFQTFQERKTTTTVMIPIDHTSFVHNYLKVPQYACICTN